MKTVKELRRTDDRGVNSVLEVYDIVSNERRTVCEFGGVIEAPNWTRDGKRLVYNRGGRIYFYDLESNTSAVLDAGFIEGCNNDHVLSADGKSIAVSHNTWEDRQSRIYTVPLTGGAPVLVTPLAPSYLHGWSPDGSTLAYCAERDGRYDIYTVPAAGGVETRLTDAPGLDDGPEYSPCGKRIWFCSTRSGLMQAWRMNADGSGQTQMTFDEANNWFPHVSPDGKWVVFLTYRKGDVEPHAHPPNKNVEIRLMSSEGGEIKTLTSLFGGQGTVNVNSWSPDSRRFAFVAYKLK